MKDKKLRNLVVISIMSAVSTVIYLILPEIPLVPGINYLKFDFSDIPALIACWVSGPFSGVMVEIVKNLLHLFRSTTLGVGEIINVGVGSAVVLSMFGFSKLFARIKKKKLPDAAVYYISGIATVLVTIVTGWALNAGLTPLYFKLMGLPCTAEIVFAGVWSSTLLNAVKAVFNIFPFYPLYYAVNRVFLKSQEANAKKCKNF